MEAIIILILFYTMLKSSTVDHARNMAFTTLVFSQLLRSFGARSPTRIFWEVGALSNFWLLGVVVFTGLLQLALHYLPFSQEIFGLQPLNIADLQLIFLLALIPITVIEIVKLLKRLLTRKGSAIAVSRFSGPARVSTG